MNKRDDELRNLFKPYGGFGTRCFHALHRCNIYSIDEFIALDPKVLKTYMDNTRDIGLKGTNIVLTVYNILRLSKDGNSESVPLVPEPEKTSRRTFNLKEAQQYYSERYNMVPKQVNDDGYLVFREERADWDHIRTMACHLNGVTTVSKIPDENLQKTIEFCKAVTDLYFDFNNNSKPDKKGDK